jgi:hypothetical protein
MEKALKFEKSCGRILFAFRTGKQNQVKAQQRGFEPERKSGEADVKPSRHRPSLCRGCVME